MNRETKPPQSTSSRDIEVKPSLRIWTVTHTNEMDRTTEALTSPFTPSMSAPQKDVCSKLVKPLAGCASRPTDAYMSNMVFREESKHSPYVACKATFSARMRSSITMPHKNLPRGMRPRIVIRLPGINAPDCKPRDKWEAWAYSQAAESPIASDPRHA